MTELDSDEVMLEEWDAAVVPEVDLVKKMDVMFEQIQ